MDWVTGGSGKGERIGSLRNWVIGELGKGERIGSPRNWVIGKLGNWVTGKRVPSLQVASARKLGKRVDWVAGRRVPSLWVALARGLGNRGTGRTVAHVKADSVQELGHWGIG